MIELFQYKNIVLLLNFIDNHVKKSYFGKKKNIILYRRQFLSASLS